MPDVLERLKSALADRYAIESEIGRGGMAAVYLAEDIRHHRKVAIKVLHPELTATLGADRFLHEIEILAGLNHPHILPLHDSGEADGLLFYVMPHAEGESLRQRLDREKQLAVDESVRIAVEVADGLDYAHRRGVVHRDVKPGNILLAEGHAVIADFGIARAIEAAKADRVTSTGLGVGTPLYASPEQATAQETLDGRTDIYSLGCVLYEMLAGQPPLTGATPQIIHARRVSETPSALHDLRDTVPPALDHVIARSLARIPADRYATASQFGQALQAAVFAATPVLHATPGILATTPAAAAAERQTRSRRRWLAAIPVLGVAVAALLWARSDRAGDGPLRITVSNILQVTRNPGLEFQPAISPDGEDVAYVEGPIRTPRIVVKSTRHLGSGGESRLAPDEPGRHWLPTWMPDGATLRYFSFVSGTGWSWKEVGKLGGTVRTVSRPWAGDNKVSPDGTRVVFHRRDSIFVYDIDTVEPRLLDSHVGTPSSQHSFAWSPDGRRIAYVNGNSRWPYSANVASTSIWIADVDGGGLVRVTGEEHLDVSPQWLPDNRHLLFVSDRDGPRGIYVVEVGADGPREPPRSVLPSSDPHSISVSADGRRLAYSKFATIQNIWSLPIPRSGSASVRDAVPVTSGNQVIEAHSLSPDGEWIAYDSDIRGEFDLYRMPLDGGASQLIADIAGTMYEPQWSPDGTEFAFHGNTHTGSSTEVFVVSADGGTPQPLTDFPGGDDLPVWSPDGLVIAYMSQGPDGNQPYTIWTVSRDSIEGQWSEPARLSDLPCRHPDWAPDGESVICDSGPDFARLSREGDVLARYPITEGVLYPGRPAYSPDGSKIYFFATAQEDGSPGVWWIPSDGGQATQAIAFDDPAISVYICLTVGPENFYLTLAEYESDIWVMDLDW